MSAELPENLQVIKLESSAALGKCNIKERLNLHVKRRLQQEVPETLHNESGLITIANKRSRVTPMPTVREIQKLRKPYQKRVERLKTEPNSKSKRAQIAILSSSAVDLETFDEPADHEAESIDSKNLCRERYKNADILNIVLSKKKQALMNDPQVQMFWSEMMSALRS
ncbi:uncharacterized protein LOC133840374 isoform X1 [Drosophila sulfurigaster albostrigata]|uniref:uncharacterized protein LOC133840374 isoform X1 n=1 Tax=Drosophila sulfurigaster albostrigata TaxID=89887 RepID=UPI002D218B04|nr:uncharacterized protein LOC133840374 isoform X1 [Drosophila sulfurigaster albostrigata]